MHCRFADIEVDWQTTEVVRAGTSVKLKPKAFQLLEFLFENRDRVVSKDELFDVLWQGRIVSDGALTTAVNDLRRALGDTGKSHQVIRTFYGQGLRFVAELEDHQETEKAASPDTETLATSSLRSKPATDPNAKVNVGLAVLPFDNLSNDPKLERLGEAIAEDLITALSKFAMLAVVSRTSSFAASKIVASLQDTARDLDVDYVVEGSLRTVDDHARLTVQLIETSGDQHVWAGQFGWPINGTSQEEFEATSLIIGQVIDQITRYEMQLARNAPDEGLTAWQYYYRGINTKKHARVEQTR
ncbi:MAG: winged helix-turn-helix domain-containing protein [Pseudomonadota bacterium]